MEAVGTAQLTDRIPAHRAVAANFSRREITDVLHEADATPELTLQLVAGEGSREQGTISITWSRDDLEKLLEAASGDDVVLTFDRNQLMAAFEDVETHGLRTRAAVFAVAALGAAGSTAAAANAYVADVGGVASTPVATAPAHTDVSSGGGYAATSQGDAAALSALQARSEAMDTAFAGKAAAESAEAALQARSEAMNVEYGSDAVAAAALQARSEALDAQYAGGSTSEAMVTDASTGGYATPAQSDDAAALQARSQALDEQYGLTAADQAATRALEARGAAMNAEYGLGDVSTTGMVTDASSAGGYSTPTATDIGGGGFQINAPSTEDALIAGAALLAIAGAGFAARRGTLHLP